MLIEQCRVLVVDDMGTMRRVVINFLNILGFKNITEAANGILAWEKVEAENGNYDLIISDWNMPEATGLDLLKKVRTKEETKKIPFILLTVEADKHNVEEAIKFQVNGYIMKPVNFEMFSKKLMDVFKRLDPELHKDIMTAVNKVK
jgi:two-component system chemotaxis response regulator CheY